MNKLVVVAAVLLAACGGLNIAQPHALLLAFKTGDAYHYNFHATSKQTAGISGMSVPIEIDTTANETVVVKSVDSSGVADLAITLSDFTLKSVGAGVTNTTTGLPANSVEVKVGSDGTVVSIDGNDLMKGSPLAAFAGVGGGYFIAAVLPGHAVKVGDTWTKSYDQQNVSGSDIGIHITSTSKYLRDEKVGAVDAAVVETKSTGTFNLNPPAGTAQHSAATMAMTGTFTTDVTSWIDPSGHRIVKSHSTSTDDLTITLPSETSTTQSPFPVQGPLTTKGDGTADLSPA